MPTLRQITAQHIDNKKHFRKSNRCICPYGAMVGWRPTLRQAIDNKKYFSGCLKLSHSLFLSQILCVK
ncbi:MAG: hypothetical protein IKI11_10405 [Neisseriaceae bacterium]|nr:hypothetical protein [Neisseriaceae bacterium]